MNHKRTVLAGLAIAALLASATSFSDEIVVTETLDAAAKSAAAEHRANLHKANSTTAEKAAEAVLADTKLDLDIRLIGPTSVKIASKR